MSASCCFKFADYELKGVPVRLVMGGRDLENNTMEVMRRDTLEKETVTCEGIETYVQNLLEEMQASADCLQQQRAIFEQYNVFSPAMIDGIIRRLRSYEDKTLRADLELMTIYWKVL